MDLKELRSILAAIIILSLVIGLSTLLKGDFSILPQAVIFSSAIIITNIIGKKLIARMLDADVEHELFKIRRYGIKSPQVLDFYVPLGIILPLVLSLFSLGILKVMTLLTYETTALKTRVSRRFGYYSYAEMTEWHNALIGAAGIISLFILAAITYSIPATNLEQLSKLAVYYTLFNLIPLGKLDGTQIFFGSKILWMTLAIISAILTAVALVIP